MSPDTPRVLTRLWRIGRFPLLLTSLPTLLLFFFGFFIKTTDEYACTMHILERNRVVRREIGEPIEPGLFAWTLYFESGGAVRQGAFSTSISGPEGKGQVRVEFYRAPVGATLYIRLKTKAGETDIYDGQYVCP